MKTRECAAEQWMNEYADLYIEHTVRIGFADDTDTLRTGLRLVGEFLDRLTAAR